MSDTIVLPGTPPAPPANAQEARTRLDALIADNGKSAKLLAGDVQINREFAELSALAAGEDASTIAQALSGDIGEMPNSQLKMAAETAGMLRDIGINERVISQVLQGHEVSPEEYKLTEAWRKRQMQDPVFVKAYLSGEPEAREKMTLASIILSGGVKGQSGSF
jgi:hypothetical protein